MVWDENKTFGRNQRDEFIAIGEFKGKAALYFYGFHACLHAGEIVIPSGSAVLSRTPQTFEVRNFEKVYQPDNECDVNTPSNKIRDSFSASVTLSSNDKGDILFSFSINTYTPQNDLFQNLSANNVVFPVKNTPGKINNITSSPYKDLANRIATEYHKGWKFDKLYVANSISNISVMEKDKANNPIRVRVDCMFNFNGQKDGWFDILFNNNKPFGIVYSIEQLSCITPLKYQSGESVPYTAVEVSNMRKLQMRYLLNYLIPIQKARDNKTNCLSPASITTYEPYEYSEVVIDPRNYRQFLVKKQSSRPNGSTPGLRNDCSTQYYLKGLARTFEENSVTIVDVSTKVAPGQTIRAVPIQNQLSYNALLDFSEASPLIYYR